MNEDSASGSSPVLGWLKMPALALMFLVLILALNAQLLRTPLHEFTDYALNSLEVQQAKHFRLLVGHYSRFHFHHPGPAYLYLFGLGEFIFFDLLHIVPAPFNGQIVITIILNVALLAAVFSIFKRRLGGGFSVPSALAATTLVAVMVNRSGPPSMLISNWMPNVLLFSFLLFLVSAASVFAGETRDLPFVALSGMLLIHAHIAQFMFVGLIGGWVAASVGWRAFRAGNPGAFLWERRLHFGLAAVICALFALPPLFDIVVHHPNNLDDVLAYQRQHTERNGIGVAIRYFFSFLTFAGPPELVLADPNGGIIRNLASHPWTMAYWAAFGVLTMAAAGFVYKDANRLALPSFLKYLSLTAIAAVALFVYWGTRITGALYAFNGRFIFSIHLLLWFGLFAVLNHYLAVRQQRMAAALAIVFTVTLAYVERAALQPGVPDIPDGMRAAALVQTNGLERLDITFPQDGWPWAASLANAMQRVGKPFCVGGDWGFMFSRENVCKDELRAAKLLVAAAREELPCAAPCKPVYRGKTFSVLYEPAGLSLPIEIGLAQSSSVERTGFHTNEGAYSYTEGHAALRFLLRRDLPSGKCFHLELRGFVPPGETTEASLNGHSLGTLIQHDPVVATFRVNRDGLLPGEINTISLDTHRVGPAGPQAGCFGFRSLALRLADAREACPVISSGQPAYAPMIKGAGVPADFNSDGSSDVVWQNSAGGESQIWFLDGPQGITRLGAAPLANRNEWRIAAIADFDRDGHPDLVWQHPVSGASEVWFMGGFQGNTLIGATALPADSHHWRIVSVADFNRDGHPDLLWQDPISGRVRIWYMGGPQGTTLLSEADVTGPNTWRVVGSGDFNGDGQPDLLCQDPASGATQVWYLGGEQGNVVKASGPFAGSNQRRVAAVADFNRDGHPDVVWQDPVSGASQIWFMGGAQGTTQLGSSVLSGPNAWRIAGPR